MTPAQEQKLSKYQKFQEYLHQFPDAFELYPHLKPSYDLFNQRLLLILKTKQMLDVYAQSKSVRNVLIQTAALFSRKITSFALLEDITELQGLGFSSHELMASDDEHVLNICQLLLGKAEHFRTDLVDYSIDDMAINGFRDQIDRFTVTMHNAVISNELVTQTFDEFSNLFHQADELFQKKLEPIMLEDSSKS